jgi:hypothetical protein
MGHGIKDCIVSLAKEKASNMQSNIATKHNYLYVAALIMVDDSHYTWYVDTGVTNRMTMTLSHLCHIVSGRKANLFIYGIIQPMK